MTNWTVLCPGPSLRRVQPEEFYADGPVVAVNNAILAPLPADFWCCLDPPRKFEQIWRKLSILERKNLATVWCRERSAPGWQELHFRVWPFAETEQEFRAQNLPHVRERTTTMLNLTMLATISRCIGLGASHVDVFGCDMAGASYAFGADQDNRAPEVWRDRWSQEPQILAIALQEWKQCGTTVSFRQPPT